VKTIQFLILGEGDGSVKLVSSTAYCSKKNCLFKAYYNQ